MASSESFDLIVIGGGPAGYVAAIRAAQLGMKVACIEKRNALGGTCLNVGCIPSKALLDSSEHFLFSKTKLAKHGVNVSSVALDLSVMMKRKDEIVKSLTQGIAGLFKKNKVTSVSGTGRLRGKKGELHEVEVVGGASPQTLTAKNVLLATGSEPVEIKSIPFDGKRIVSSTEALALEKVPGKMVVVGAGFIGLEMGSVWKRLGSEVTVIEYSDRFLPTMDGQVAEELKKSLTKQGLVIRLGTQCLGVKPDGSGVKVEVQEKAGGKMDSLPADVVLVSAGRRPYSDGLGLEDLGIARDPQGRVPVNDHYETKVPGIFAVGDLIAGPMLAHKAEEEGIAAVENMAGQKGHVNYLAIPGVIYTWPEVASVGYTEEQLKEKGVTYRSGTFPFMANGRAKAMDETEGLVKVLADGKTDRVLGVHIIGPRASDMIAEAVAVMEFGGSAEDIARTCHAHPTLSEAFKEAAMAVDNRKIHL